MTLSAAKLTATTAVAALMSYACASSDEKAKAATGGTGNLPENTSGGTHGGAESGQGGVAPNLGGTRAGAAANGGVSGPGGSNANTGGAADSGAANLTGGAAGASALGGAGGSASGAAGSAQTLGGNKGQGASGGAAGASNGGSATGGGGGALAGGAGGMPAQRFVYASGYGPNVTVLTLDMSSGVLKSVGTTAGGDSPSYAAIAPGGRFLYVVNETSPSRVIAFAIDAKTGALSEINRQNTTGDGAPHLSVHPSGKWVAVAHYGSGHVTILPVQDNGGVGAASDTSRGPNDGCQKAHQTVFDASGKYLFVPCLGSNYVIQFKFDAGKLALNTPSTIAVPGGPRHLAFDPTEQHAYVLSELESKLTSLDYDKSTGRFSNAMTISSVERTTGSIGRVSLRFQSHREQHRTVRPGRRERRSEPRELRDGDDLRSPGFHRRAERAFPDRREPKRFRRPRRLPHRRVRWPPLARR
jgi:hypothetical protein